MRSRRGELALGIALLLGAAQAVAQEVVTPTEWVGDLRDLPGERAWRAGDPIVEVPRRTLDEGAAPASEAGHEGVDPLLARQAELGMPAGLDGFGTPVLSFAGQPFSGSQPPDTIGDVGPAHYLQAVNSTSGARFVVYDKSGAALTAPILFETLGSAACADGRGDPVVVWDPLADRWILLEFTSSTAKTLCVYVSKSADPVAGGWWAYAFQATDYPDYPKLAVWPEAYIVTTNESTPAIYALERPAMLDGLAATKLRFSVPKLSAFVFNALTPADLDGAEPPPEGAPGILVRHRDTEAHGPAGLPVTDQIELWELTADFAVPANSVLSGPLALSITEFSSDLCGLTNFRCVPQPEPAGFPTVNLDPLREVVMHRLAYRRLPAFEQLVGNFVTDAGDFTDHHAVRWFELERRDGGSWQVRQEGTYAPDPVHRWMGAIASDKEGNLALGYNVSRATVGEEVYPGIRYAGRRAEAPVGTLPEGEHPGATGLNYSSTNRYGDYSAMSVDPADECTFWFTGEYHPILASHSWATRILAFRFDGCDGSLIFRDGFELGTTSRWIEVVPPPPPPEGGPESPSGSPAD